jgi:hypothetical protein
LSRQPIRVGCIEGILIQSLPNLSLVPGHDLLDAWVESTVFRNGVEEGAAPEVLGSEPLPQEVEDQQEPPSGRLGPTLNFALKPRRPPPVPKIQGSADQFVLKADVGLGEGDRVRRADLARQLLPLLFESLWPDSVDSSPSEAPFGACIALHSQINSHNPSTALEE